INNFGDIAQLARAPALQAGGPGFESLCLHQDLSLTEAVGYKSWQECRHLNHGVDRAKVRFYSTIISSCGRLAQLARASRLHREGRGFERLSAHHEIIQNIPYMGATSSVG